MSKPTFKEEKELWEKGYECVIGLDEVGRGAFAGPVAVGAVVYRINTVNSSSLNGINDSKLLNPGQRQKLVKIIQENCQYCATSLVQVPIINKIGIGKATKMAFRKVLKEVKTKIGKKKIFVLIDGFHIQYLKGIGLRNQKTIIKGDQKSISIASASIIAKVYRDKLMKSLHKKYPNYNFAKNKGYGTKFHQSAIKKYGLSKIHRKSFNLSKFC